MFLVSGQDHYGKNTYSPLPGSLVGLGGGFRMVTLPGENGLVVSGHFKRLAGHSLSSFVFCGILHITLKV